MTKTAELENNENIGRLLTKISKAESRRRHKNNMSKEKKEEQRKKQIVASRKYRKNM